MLGFRRVALVNSVCVCVCRMSESMRSAFAARLLLRKEQLDIEKQLKENRLRLIHREEWHQQGLLFFPDDKAEKVLVSHAAGHKNEVIQGHVLSKDELEPNDGLSS